VDLQEKKVISKHFFEHVEIFLGIFVSITLDTLSRQHRPAFFAVFQLLARTASPLPNYNYLCFTVHSAPALRLADKEQIA